MKRITKIFAIFLSVCLLSGLFAIFSSAKAPESATDLGYANNHDGLSIGTTPSYIANGAGSSVATTTKVASKFGNKYLRVLYEKDSVSDKNTRKDLKFGIFSSTKSAQSVYEKIQSGETTGLSGYSYLTIDFDLAADQYRYLLDVPVEKEVEYDTGEVDDAGNPIMGTKTETVYETQEFLSEEYPTAEGAYGIRLAYANKSYFELDIRPIIKLTASDGTVTYSYPGSNGISSKYVSLTVCIVYDTVNEVWNIYNSKSSTNQQYFMGTLSNNLGEWNHFSYVIDINHDNIGQTEGKLYLNGEPVSTGKIWTEDTYRDRIVDFLPFAIDWTILNSKTTTVANNAKYSMAVDNFQPLYYASDYTSGDKAGIDDLFDPESGITSVVQCEDSVYNVDYVSPAPNGYADIDGKKIYVNAAISEALKSLKNGSVITTTMDLLEITPPTWTAFTVKCNPGTEVTLSEEAIASGITIRKTLTGYEVSSGIKANMSLFTDMRFNLYLPKLDGIEITSVNGAALLDYTVKIAGVEMYVVSATPDIDNFAAIPVTINYTQNGVNKTYATALDSMAYATTVANTYECGSKEATLIYEMVKYKEAAATLLNYDFVEETGKLASFLALYDAHDNCKCKNTKVTISEEEKNVEYSSLSSVGVTGIAYKLSLNEIGVAVYVNDGVNVDSVSYENALGETITHSVANGNLLKKNGYFFVSGVSAAYIDQIMTITVGEATGKYSLGKYIINNPDVEIGEALYKYSVAAENYKNSTLPEIIVSVDYLRENATVGEEYVVEGYYVGLGDEGALSTGAIGEMYLKSPDSDKIIAVQDVPYGQKYAYGYEKGDLVRLNVTLNESNNSHQRKRIASFNVGKNHENIEDTIISRDNKVTYKLNDVITVKSWTEMKNVINTTNINAYTYIHFDGAGYIQRLTNSADDIYLYRPHMNASATTYKGQDGMQPDGSRALGFRAPMLTNNVKSAWSSYYGKDQSGYPGKALDLDIYCVVTKINSINYILTILEGDWIKQKNHEHVYEGEWTIDVEPTVQEPGLEYRVCTECSIREYRDIAKSEFERIEIVSTPTKLSYLPGEVLDVTGLKVVGITKDGKTIDITDNIELSKVLLSLDDENIIVSYSDLRASFAIEMITPSISVSEVKKNGVEGEVYYVEGLVAGYSQDGPGYKINILLKDKESDDLIALTGISNENYAKGDLIKVFATFGLSTDTNTPGKKILTYSTENYADVSKTIVSRNNKITYKFDNVVTLSSFDEWKDLFKVSTIDEYTFVRIVGPIYGSSYASSTDNLYSRRIHTIPKGTSTVENSKTKPDGTRYVALRDNIMDMNCGTLWKNCFEGNFTQNAAHGISCKADELIAVYTGASASYFQLSVLENDWFIFAEEVVSYTNADVVVQIAKAFDERGSYIQYNQTKSRRHINPSPEEATAQNQVYLDCSSYVNAVYYEAFGVNILPYATTTKSPNTSNYRDYARDNNGIANDVIGYWLCSDYKTEAEQKALLASIYDMLEVGDILNYRKGSKGSSGHVYVYIGDGVFMHCTGKDYIFDDDASASYDGANNSEIRSGSISTETAYNIFENTTHARYLFNNQFDISLLRPLNRGLTPTEESVARMNARGLILNKSSNVGINTAVYRDQLITYTLKVENTAAYRRNLLFNEIISNAAEYVSGSLPFDVTESGISSNVTVNPFETMTITWTVKVKNNAEAGALVTSDTTFGGISGMQYRSTVSAYTESQMQALAQKAIEYANSAKTFSDPSLMVEALYNEVFGIDLYSYESVADLLQDFTYIYNEEKGYHNLNEECEIVDIRAPYLYGGVSITYPIFTRDTEVIRLITLNHISIGDVILATDSGKTVAFVYVGDGSFLTISSTDNVCKIVTMSGDAYTASNILVTIFAYDKYVTLRPSMR